MTRGTGQDQPPGPRMVSLAGDVVIGAARLLACTVYLLLVAVEFLGCRGRREVVVDPAGVERRGRDRHTPTRRRPTRADPTRAYPAGTDHADPPPVASAAPDADGLRPRFTQDASQVLGGQLSFGWEIASRDDADDSSLVEVPMPLRIGGPSASGARCIDQYRRRPSTAGPASARRVHGLRWRPDV